MIVKTEMHWRQKGEYTYILLVDYKDNGECNITMHVMSPHHNRTIPLVNSRNVPVEDMSIALRELSNEELQRQTYAIISHRSVQVLRHLEAIVYPGSNFNLIPQRIVVLEDNYIDHRYQLSQFIQYRGLWTLTGSAVIYSLNPEEIRWFRNPIPGREGNVHNFIPG